MVEYPGEWDLVTACLAVSNLDEPDRTWDFLAAAGVVVDNPKNRERFGEITRERLARGPITGPTPAFSIGGALTREGIATPRGGSKDPFAKKAKPMRERFDRGEKPAELLARLLGR